MAWVAAAVIGSAVVGGAVASKSSKDATRAATDNAAADRAAQIEATKLDPRIDQLIYGAPDQTTGGGIVGRINGLLDQNKSSGTQAFNEANNSYLKDWGNNNFIDSQRAAQGLQSSSLPASYITADRMTGAKIDAPSQNELDLTKGYNDMIYGNPAENPYLTGALQGGINQSQQAFDRMQTDATDNFTKNILGNIRQGAQVSGQYGGSRQGIAEGNAAGEFAKQMARATSDYGQRNTDAITGAQAGAFESGQNRALSAMSGLGAQQYGVAGQNAQFEQQQNINNQQTAMQSMMNNSASQDRANALNSTNKVAGVNLSSGLLGQAYNYNQNADNANINRVSQVSGLLQPYANKGTPLPSQQPIYDNSGGAAMGGAMAGLGLFNSIKGAFSPTDSIKTTSYPAAGGSNSFIPNNLF